MRRWTRPAPSAPSRLPVDAFTLTASGRAAVTQRSPPRIASRCAAESRPCAPRSSGRPRPGASRRRADGRRPSASSAPAIDASRRLRPGREQAPEIAERGRAEQRIGDRMERDVAVGMAVEARRPGDLDTAESQRFAGSEGWMSWPIAGPRPSGSAQERCGPVEVGGDRHLEVGGIAGHDMHGDSTGLQQRGLVGPCPVLGASGRERRRGSSARRTPCGVCAATRSVRSTVASIRSPATRLSVSPTGTAGIAAPWRSAAATTASTRSTRRPGGRRRGRARRARPPGRAPCAPAHRTPPGPSPGVARRRATNVRSLGQPPRPRAARRDVRPWSRRRWTRPPGSRRARSDRVRQQRSIADRREQLVGRRPSASRRRQRRRSRRPSGRMPRHQPEESSRGCAKIIRPATVWRTRVTGRRGPCRCAERHPRPRSSCRRRGSRHPARPPCLPG